MLLLPNSIFFHIYSFTRYLHTTGLLTQNHYEKLNLSRNCSAQDIKNSFIQLSKKYHPDINRSPDAHKKFLEINEAYKILSNPTSRHKYDLGLIPHRVVYSSREPHIHQREPFTNPWKDSSFYENRDKSQDKYYADQPYYGIKGIQKVSNFTVVMMCLTISAVGAILQFMAVRKSFTLHRDEMIRKSNEAQRTLEGIKEAAQTNGNDFQIELLKQRLADQRRNK